MRSVRTRRRTGLLWVGLLLGGAWGLPAQADVFDAVAIAKILTEPAAYNLEVVTLIGTIREIRPIKAEGNCAGNGYILFLRDETGELAIRNQPLCTEDEQLPAIEGHYTRGERVVVRAAITEHPTRPTDQAGLEATLVRIDRVGE